MEEIAEVESMSRCCALTEQALLATATGWLERTTDRNVQTSQCALLHTQLLHTALQHERIAALQCDT
jgi:hypothetical protein